MDKIRKFLNFKKHWETYAFVLILALFIFQSLYFALKLDVGIWPDEAHHVGIIKEFTKTFWIPSNSSSSYQYGDITRIPFLYYWIMARLYSLNVFSFTIVTFLKIINIIFGVFSLIFTYLTTRLLFKKTILRLFPILLLSNTLMFVFLFAGVSYDNLTNLLSIISIYFFVLNFYKEDLRLVLMFLIMLCLGSLTKSTFLPLALILFLILSISKLKKFRIYLQNLKNSVWIDYLLVSMILIFSFFNFSLYGYNLLKYRSLEPNCNQILTHKQCMEYPIYSRNYEIDNMEKPENRIGLAEYFMKWGEMMMRKTYGIMGHRAIYNDVVNLLPIVLIISISLFNGIFTPKKKRRVIFPFISIFLFYTLVLISKNYSVYLDSNMLGLAVQGRYIFPVIFVLYFLIANLLFTIKNNYIIYSLSLIIILTFLLNSLPFFMQNVPLTWYKSYSYKSYGVTFNNNDHLSNGITDDSDFYQTFKSVDNGLVGFSIFINNFGNKYLSDYELVLLDGECNIAIEKVDIDENSLDKDGVFLDIYLDEPIESSIDEVFCFSIQPVRDFVIRPITVQLSEEGSYADGQLILRGEKSEKDIVFKTIHKK